MKTDKFKEYIANITGMQSANNSTVISDMGALVKEIKHRDALLTKISSTKQSLDVKAGFAVEQSHAESFNLNAIANGKDIRAITDSDAGWKTIGLKKNDVPDIVTTNDGKTISSQAQVKYYGTAEKSANALREQKPQDGSAKYGDMDQHLVPSDQVEGVKIAANKTILKNQNSRPDVAKAAEHVKQKATATLKDGGVESAEMTKKDAIELAKNPQNSKPRKEYQDKAKNETLTRNTSGAMVSAAKSAGIVSGTVNSLTCLSQMAQGKISAKEAVITTASETLCSAVDASAKAGLSTAILGKLTAEGLIKEGVKGVATKNAVVVGAVCAVELAKDLASCAQGNIDTKELPDRVAKNGVNALVSASATAIAKKAAMALGTTGAATPAVMAMVATTAISTAINKAFEVAIEQPHKNMVANTEAVCGLLDEVASVGKKMAAGEMVLSNFLDVAHKQQAEFNTARSHGQAFFNELNTTRSHGKILSKNMKDAISSI